MHSFSVVMLFAYLFSRMFPISCIHLLYLSVRHPTLPSSAAPIFVQTNDAGTRTQYISGWMTDNTATSSA